MVGFDLPPERQSRKEDAWVHLSLLTIWHGNIAIEEKIPGSDCFREPRTGPPFTFHLQLHPEKSES